MPGHLDRYALQPPSPPGLVARRRRRPAVRRGEAAAAATEAARRARVLQSPYRRIAAHGLLGRRPLPRGRLAEIDYVLRDFRTGEVRRIDPALLDLVHRLRQVMDCRPAGARHLRVSLARDQRDAGASAARAWRRTAITSKAWRSTSACPSRRLGGSARRGAGARRGRRRLLSEVRFRAHGHGTGARLVAQARAGLGVNGTTPGRINRQLMFALRMLARNMRALNLGSWKRF